MTSVASSTRSEWSTRLAQALVQSGYQTDGAMKPLVNEALATDQTLAYLLISRNLALPSLVVGTLSQLSELPAVDLAAFTPQPEAVAALPAPVGREFGAIALQFDGNALAVAFAEPPSSQDVDDLAGRVGHRIHPMLADPVLIGQHIGMTGDVEPLVADADALVEPTDSRDRSAIVDDLLSNGIQVKADDDSVPLHIDDLLRYAVSVGASDLHLTVAMPGTIRLHGAMRPIEGCPPLTNDLIRDMVFGILPASQRERFEAEHELDTSHTIPGVGRFRVNVALQRGTVTAALRPIPHEMPVFSSLGLPDSIRAFTDLRRGLVLVTGPTGSGKSTTLASLIDIINRTKPLHIVTVEDPIEFLHDHKRSIITQREIGEDTNSFAEALRRVLRQDPDVILVGELRDLETISMALTAAETGHHVFGTLHTQDAPQTIDRIVDVFPTQQQEQIRVMLASTLEGVVTQQLVPTADGNGRAPCAEVLVCTSAVRNLIRQSKTHQIYSLMQVGGSFGMQTMDQGLANMVKSGIISESIAYDRSSNEEDLRNHLHH
jgi:twitching motility protein PilT